MPRNHPLPAASDNADYRYPLARSQNETEVHAPNYEKCVSPAAMPPARLQRDEIIKEGQHRHGTYSSAGRSAQQRSSLCEPLEWSAAAKAQRRHRPGDVRGRHPTDGTFHALMENSCQHDNALYAGPQENGSLHRCRSATPLLVARADADDSQEETFAATQTSPKRCFSLRKSAKAFVPTAARAWEFVSTAVNTERYLRKHGEGVAQLPQSERPEELRTPAPDELNIWVSMGSSPAPSARDPDSSQGRTLT